MPVWSCFWVPTQVSSWKSMMSLKSTTVWVRSVKALITKKLNSVFFVATSISYGTTIVLKINHCLDVYSDMPSLQCVLTDLPTHSSFLFVWATADKADYVLFELQVYRLRSSKDKLDFLHHFTPHWLPTLRPKAISTTRITLHSTGCRLPFVQTQA